MGYESKLYFVQCSPYGSRGLDSDKIFAEKIVEINMCKIDGMPSCFRKVSDYYVYADDGNTEIIEDKYGEPLYQCEVKDLYDWLKKTMLEDPEGYRRYDLLLNVIKGFADFTYLDEWIDLKPKWQWIKVLHFGY